MGVNRLRIAACVLTVAASGVASGCGKSASGIGQLGKDHDALCTAVSNDDIGRAVGGSVTRKAGDKADTSGIDRSAFSCDLTMTGGRRISVEAYDDVLNGDVSPQAIVKKDLDTEVEVAAKGTAWHPVAGLGDAAGWFQDDQNHDAEMLVTFHANGERAQLLIHAWRVPAESETLTQLTSLAKTYLDKLS